MEQHSAEPAEYLFAYAAKICRNLALNKIEREQAAKRNAVVVELSTELMQCIPDNDLATDETGLRELLVRFLEELPEENESCSFEGTGTGNP